MERASRLGGFDQFSQAFEGLDDLFALCRSDVAQGIRERREQSTGCCSSVFRDLVGNGDSADTAIIGVRVPTDISAARQPIHDARHRAMR